MTASFVHLRLHTEFSLVDSVVRVDELVEAVAAAGMPAVGISDQYNLFAMVKFYRAALARGVQPIVGVDLHVREHCRSAGTLAPDAAVPEPGGLSQPDAAGVARLAGRAGQGRAADRA